VQPTQSSSRFSFHPRPNKSTRKPEPQMSRRTNWFDHRLATGFDPQAIKLGIPLHEPESAWTANQQLMLFVVHGPNACAKRMEAFHEPASILMRSFVAYATKGCTCEFMVPMRFKKEMEAFHEPSACCRQLVGGRSLVLPTRRRQHVAGGTFL
jgi:hypothetical protein